MLNRLGSTDGGNYFLGGEYTLADVAHSTPYFRTIMMLKPARGIDVNALIKEHGLSRWVFAGIVGKAGDTQGNGRGRKGGKPE